MKTKITLRDIAKSAAFSVGYWHGNALRNRRVFGMQYDPHSLGARFEARATLLMFKGRFKKEIRDEINKGLQCILKQP